MLNGWSGAEIGRVVVSNREMEWCHDEWSGVEMVR